MTAITDLTTLAVADITASDVFPIHDDSAGTDKKAALFETGTWTPTLRFSGATTGITYNSRNGTYTRIGRIVVASGFFYLSSKGSATGTASIAGLPYTAINVSGAYWVGATTWQNMAGNGYTITSTVVYNESTIGMGVSTTTATLAAATDATFTNDSIITVTIVYEAQAT